MVWLKNSIIMEGMEDGLWVLSWVSDADNFKIGDADNFRIGDADNFQLSNRDRF